MRRLAVLVISVLGACTQSPEPTAPLSPYRRPVIEEVLKRADFADDLGVGQEFDRDAGHTQRGRTAYQALWDTVKQAEEAGLRELYGMETFVRPDVSYRGQLYVLLEDGRAFWLFADGDFHEHGREDTSTVPAWPVGSDAFAKLRQRIAVELPLTGPAKLTTRVFDGGFYLLHAYKDGQSHSALWLDPADYKEFDRDLHREFVEAFPALSVIGALWAAIPLDALPVKPERFPIDLLEWYGQAASLKDVLAGRAK
jgi:hypothetical protein